jgi:glycolate oxidase
MLAPIGSLEVITPDGGCASARAAAEFGTLQVVSTVTQPGLEEIAAASDSPKIFQLYVNGDMTWVKEILTRMKAAGYIALVLTCDLASYSRRERPLLTRWDNPNQRTMEQRRNRALVTWEMMDEIKAFAGLPFMVKGVATPEDAELCVQHGVDVVWVSNHGGRQLDHGLATIEMLPEIVSAVGGKADIVLDSGIQRGTDVLKALALGAKAVAIGKLQGWGLGAGGAPGLVRVLELLEEEIKIAMGLLGVTSMDQLDASYLTKAEPVTLPHEMSAWVNMPGGRLL